MADEQLDGKQGQYTVDSAKNYDKLSPNMFVKESINGDPDGSIKHAPLICLMSSHNTQTHVDMPSGDEFISSDDQVVQAHDNALVPRRVYWPSKSYCVKITESEDNDDDGVFTKTLIDHAWSRRVLQLVGNKAKLMESFSWLSTVGGGYSALGENDTHFSSRAGALSLGQQLRLAELLGDERLRVMCHIFAALAASQMNNNRFGLNYVKRVIIPLMNAMPYRDQMLTNMLKHICFRLATGGGFMGVRRRSAIDSVPGSFANRIGNNDPSRPQ